VLFLHLADVFLEAGDGLLLIPQGLSRGAEGRRSEGAGEHGSEGAEGKMEDGNGRME